MQKATICRIEAVAVRLLAEKRIHEITANMQKCPTYSETSSVIIATLAPTLGRETAARLLQQSLQEEKSIRQVIAEDRLLSTEELDAILDLPALAAE